MAVETNILLQSGTNEFEIVEFEISYTKSGKEYHQYFGINVAKVREIIRMPKLTQLPNLPEFVYGVFNLRGSIIPALDLTNFMFGFENTFKDRKMIISEFNRVKVGLIVKDVRRIHRISWKQIVSPEVVQQWDVDQSTIVGIINMDDRQILMLDVEKIVADIDPKSALSSSFEGKLFDNKPKVVIAEDSMMINKMITNKLNESGMDVKSFKDGESAWNYIDEMVNDTENEVQLDLVITDIEMPKMDGYSLTKKIKSNERLKKVPVLIFSSIISKDILHKGESVGADAQLSKPDLDELINISRDLLK
jgi:two-component system chemotaxis response regulator CheV